MSEDQPSDQPDEQPSPTFEFFLFPQADLEKWVGIPEGDLVDVGPLTRGDWDRFLFSATGLAMAISHLQRALTEFSNGNLDKANEEMKASFAEVRQGEDHQRRLFHSIMKNALKGRDDAAQK